MQGFTLAAHRGEEKHLNAGLIINCMLTEEHMDIYR